MAAQRCRERASECKQSRVFPAERLFLNALPPPLVPVWGSVREPNRQASTSNHNNSCAFCVVRVCVLCLVYCVCGVSPKTTRVSQYNSDGIHFARSVTEALVVLVRLIVFFAFQRCRACLAAKPDPHRCPHCTVLEWTPALFPRPCPVNYALYCSCTECVCVYDACCVCILLFSFDPRPCSLVACHSRSRILKHKL